jgi:hypothetical protein
VAAKLVASSPSFLCSNSNFAFATLQPPTNDNNAEIAVKNDYGPAGCLEQEKAQLDPKERKSNGV